MRARIASMVAHAPRSLSPVSRPVSVRCTWQSWKPGTMAAPLQSTTCTSLGTPVGFASISLTIVPPAATIPRARGLSRSSVVTSALTYIHWSPDAAGTPALSEVILPGVPERRDRRRLPIAGQSIAHEIRPSYEEEEVRGDLSRHLLLRRRIRPFARGDV